MLFIESSLSALQPREGAAIDMGSDHQPAVPTGTNDLTLTTQRRERPNRVKRS
ncbi:hypothetical protein L842_6211 [Mycobacterium intracellulare MIN_052511_1280]|nr:hypothetical protein L842_1819 [Mycobacterium intracellulare MIN_052511_1280]ETZ36769.1 hypothetical protein L842_6211 [Mycobacterium intracellulare MIN_052511_1280]